MPGNAHWSKTARSNVRIGERSIPISLATQPAPGSEAAGRFVRVRIDTAERSTFTAKSMWASVDLGLPAAGLPIHGRIRVTGKEAAVTVLIPLATLLFFIALWLFLTVGAVCLLAGGKTGDGLVVFLLSIWFIVHSVVQSRSAVEAIAQDAVATLESAARAGT